VARQERKTADDWLALINQGLEFRKTFGLEEAWLDLEARFESISPTADTGPNILMEKGDTLLSALSVPEVSVQVEPRSEESMETAPVVEAFDNSMLEGLDIGEHMEVALQRDYLTGVGFLKVGFDSEFGFDEDKELAGIGGSLTQFGKSGRLLESGIAASGYPWVLPVMSQDVVVPWGTRVLADAEWIAHRTVRHVDDIKEDEKYLRAAKGIQGRLSLRDVVLGYSSMRERVQDQQPLPQAGTSEPKREWVELWEIMHKPTKRVIVVALSGTDDRDQADPVIIRDVENALQVMNVLPWVAVKTSPPTRALWHTPLAWYLRPHQNELDDIHCQAKIQRRISILKLLAKKGVLDASAIEQLLSRKPGMLVEVNMDSESGTLEDVVKWFNGPQNANSLLESEGMIVDSNARGAAGLSKPRSGENQGKTHVTKAETELVEQGGDARLARKQKALRRAYRQLVRILNGIMAAHMKVPTAVQIVGADGAAKWERMQASMLQSGRFTFNIRFGIEHYQSQEQRMTQKIALVKEMMQWPGVDKGLLMQAAIATINQPGVKAGGKGGGASAVPVQVPGVQSGAGSSPVSGGKK
jgi:hypothetical protein